MTRYFRVLALNDLLRNFLNICALKRLSPGHQFVHHAAKGPYVRFCVVNLPFPDLRARVGQSPRTRIVEVLDGRAHIQIAYLGNSSLEQ